MSIPTTDALLSELHRMALLAGQAILQVYESDTVKVSEKDDKSPVTEADTRAEAIILAGLELLAPDTSVIAEEAVAGGKKPVPQRRFFLVDPLDGTREFIQRNGEFTVNIALVEDRRAVAGVVLAPAIGKLFLGGAGRALAQEMDPADLLKHGAEARLTAPRRIHARHASPGALVAVASRSHRAPQTDAFLRENGISNTISSGSSLKFCLVATGEADVYPRHGTTMEWDTAAGQAVLEAAGGSVTTLDGSPFLYGKFDQGLVNPHFIGWGVR
jgi:3'(2'), 5'-bisphosphate nucleotidase